MPNVEMDRDEFVTIRNALSSAKMHFEKCFHWDSSGRIIKQFSNGESGEDALAVTTLYATKIAQCLQNIENITYQVAERNKSTKGRCARIQMPTILPKGI